MKQLRGIDGQRVLLVEDETRLREMLLRAMREMGFSPVGVGSAESAMRALNEGPFPVLVVDLNLPGAGGMDLLRDVRLHWPHMQAVILTGFGDLDAARQAIRLDVADFLTKPCALGDLEVALSRAFQRSVPLMPDPGNSSDAGAAVESGGLSRPANLAEDRTDGGRSSAASASPLEFRPREGTEALSMEHLERQAILAALEKHGSNRAAAAAELGISIRKLYYRLAQYQKMGLHIS